VGILDSSKWVSLVAIIVVNLRLVKSRVVTGRMGSSRRMEEDRGWSLENGEWMINHGGGRMEDGRWKMEDGERRMEDEG